jgi:hypothetical protein
VVVDPPGRCELLVGLPAVRGCLRCPTSRPEPGGTQSPRASTEPRAVHPAPTRSPLVAPRPTTVGVCYLRATERPRSVGVVPDRRREVGNIDPSHQYDPANHASARRAGKAQISEMVMLMRQVSLVEQLVQIPSSAVGDYRRTERVVGFDPAPSDRGLTRQRPQRLAAMGRCPERCRARRTRT